VALVPVGIGSQDRTGQETAPERLCTGPMSREAMERTVEIEMGSGQQPWDLPNIRFPGQYYDAETGRGRRRGCTTTGSDISIRGLGAM